MHSLDTHRLDFFDNLIDEDERDDNGEDFFSEACNMLDKIAAF
jgi:hypothetical protein